MSAPSIEATTDRMYRELSRLLRSYEMCDQGCISRLGVTASQGYTLLAFPEDASMTMNDLSQAMGLANSTMTRMVDNLVDKGLVHRRLDDEDRRVMRVGLTSKGKSLRSAVDAERRTLLRRLLSGVPEAEWDGILKSLRALNRAVETAVRDCCGS